MNEKQQARLDRNTAYWKDRRGLAQQKLTDKNIKETEKQLMEYYKSSMKKTVGRFEEVYLKLLSNIDGKDFKPEEIYEVIKAAATPADLYKLDAYWQLQGELRDELTKLGDKQAALFSKKFMAQYADIYEACALKDDLFFGELSKETAQQMINSIWCADGKSWAQRIGINNDKLREALNDNLIHCVLTGKTTTELKEILQQDFLMDYNRADKIIRTEMAHIQTEAAKQRYLDSGIEEVEVWADLDERRCDVCGELHEKRFNVNATMPVPAHPNCRCVVIPVVQPNNQLMVV